MDRRTFLTTLPFLVSCAYPKSRFSLFDLSAMDNIGLSVKQKYNANSQHILFNVVISAIDNDYDLPGVEYVLQNYTIGAFYVEEAMVSKDYTSILNHCAKKHRLFYRSADTTGSCLDGDDGLDSTRRMLRHIVSNDHSLSLAVSVESLETEIRKWNDDNKNAIFSYAIINSINVGELPCESLKRCYG